MISLVTKLPHLTMDEFNDYWSNQHAMLAKKLPGLKRYFQNHIIQQECESALSPKVEGVAELWFNSRKDMEKAFLSDVGRELMEDEKKFIATVDAYCVDEFIICDL
jgi:uncharacterized protein (TIGR02118 family)